MRPLSRHLWPVGLFLIARLAGATVTDNRLHNSKLMAFDSLAWLPGTAILRFENLEGMVLLRGTLRGDGDRDTTGPIALDTGAGYLALDLGLARTLGLADRAAATDAVGLAARPLKRLTLGGWSIDQVEPVLTVDGEIVRRVSDRPVLGLLGHKPLRDRIVWIDYREEVVAFAPARTAAEGPADTATASVATAGRGSEDSTLARSRLGLTGLLTTRAVAVPFQLVGDGKMVVHGRVSDPRPPHYSSPLTLLIDTGATKCVLFEDSLGARVGHADQWPALRGLSAPTLIGAAEARIARIPSIQVDAAGGPLSTHDVDAGVIRSDLSQLLARVTHETIHGVIGYSMLKRFRVAIDYPNRVLWLDPIADYREPRPLEYCHVGLQLERKNGAVVVMGVAEGSPAARAGIARDDELVALDGTPVRGLDLVALARWMEGEPGRPLTLVVRRNSVDRTYRLVRRRLL